MKEISIIFPNQLFRINPLLDINCEILIIEDSLFFGNDKNYSFKNHINKLIFLKASINFYKDYLEKNGVKVIHAKNEDFFTTYDYLNKYIGKNFKKINVINPHDFLIQKRLKKFVECQNIELNCIQSPMFITKKDIERSLKRSAKKPLMGKFYENQRRSHNLLLNDDGTPLGGKWSFDDLNRKKLPKSIKVPEMKEFNKNSYVKKAEEFLKESKLLHLGSKEYFFYPTNFEEADDWLNDFLENRFCLFGDYEDAISQENNFLWHSILSPLLNSGLLTPQEVIDSALAYGEKKSIPLNSIEGFVRQVIGWREFICLVYEKYGVKMRSTNFWNFKKRKLPNSFYEGSTGIEPVDQVIKNILKYGYCHHIERLMILGNFMLLCRFHPDEVYKWFMEMFIDSYDWVMVPNVYGMSQFSDGGIFSTKPYISSSNYIRKMSDYKNDEWCSIWDGLFWKFIFDHKEFFKKQYRLSMMARNLEKMKPEKLNNHLEVASCFLKKL